MDYQEMYDNVAKMVSDLRLEIEEELEKNKFIDREDLLSMIEDTKTKIVDIYGPEIFCNPSNQWNMVFADAKICLLPRLGIRHVQGGNREAKMRLSIPSGDVMTLVTYKGFV